MKTLYLFAILCLLCGCDQPNSDNGKDYSRFSTVITVDKCQYAVHLSYGQNKNYTHLGSCTNCWAKMQHMIYDSKLEKEDTPITVVRPKEQPQPKQALQKTPVYATFNEPALVNGCLYYADGQSSWRHAGFGNCTNCQAKMSNVFREALFPKVTDATENK